MKHKMDYHWREMKEDKTIRKKKKPHNNIVYNNSLKSPKKIQTNWLVNMRTIQKKLINTHKKSLQRVLYQI